MKRRLFTLAVFFAFYHQSHAQDQYELQKPDSLKIDSLKKLLPSLKGADRVDCMLRISLHIGYMHPWGGFTFKKDSTRRYNTIAYDEAKTLNYKQGIALSMLGLLPDSGKEKKIREAIQIGEEIKSDKVLGWAYYRLADNNNGPANFKQHVEYYKKAISHFLKAGDTIRAAEVCTWLSSDYFYSTEYEDAFEYSKISLELLKKEDSEFLSWQKDLIQMASESMADLYALAGDYEAALNQTRIAGYEPIYGPISLARIFLEMGQYDSTLVYYNRWRNQPYFFSNTISLHRAYQYPIMAGIYLNRKEYDKAIGLLSTCIDTVRQHMKPPRNWKPAGQQWLAMSEAYAGKMNYNTALSYAKEAVLFAEDRNVLSEMMKGYQQLSSIFHKQGKDDSAYKYLLKYTITKDSLQNKQLLLKLYNNLYKYKKEAEDAKKQAEIGFLNRDNQIKRQQLKQEATFRNFLITVFIAIIFAGLYVFRILVLKRKNERIQRERAEQEWKVQKLEHEKKQAELKRQASDLQMQALRAQMNPHFIFNSLSSINWFIMENNKEKASDYLTRFSRLMRMVLNAQKPAISLEDELKMLELYLDMERMRLEYNFDYSVTYTNAVDAGTISIPPMLLQPFCENAIWHGFANMPVIANVSQVQAHLNINIRAEDNMIEFAITDNGIGRKEAEVLASRSVKKQKSKGLSITRERLALFSQENNAYAGFEIEDLSDEIGKAAGTRVILKIAFRELIEEVA